MQKRIAILIVTFFIVVPGLISAQQSSGFDLNNLDKSASPAQDFYQYAVGGWMKKNPIPDEYSRWGSFEQLEERTNKNLKSLLEKFSANQNKQSGSAEQMIGDFFATGIDSSLVERLGMKPIIPELAKLNLVRSTKDLVNLFAEESLYGVNIPFNFFASVDAKKSTVMVSRLYQGGVALPDVEYYTKDDARSKEIREKYAEYIVNMFKLINASEDEAKANAQIVMNIETRLAKASNTRLENRNPEKTYNKMGIDQLKKLSPGFDWEVYFEGLGIERPPVVVVGQPKFFEEAGKMINEVPLNDWKVYIKWHIINNAANFLSSDFVNARFDFYGKFLNGTKALQPRWKRVLQTLNGSIGELIGQLYVAEYFPPEAKERAKNIVNNLLVSMGESIKNLDWMSGETKEQALVKLGTFGVKIGYPDKWKDYSELEIKRDTYFKNILRANYWSSKDNLKKIGQPVDKTEWGMNPQTVNAYYSPVRNEIVFPAAILQWPFFDQSADDAINYGAMGVVIGHEITHGFDDQGRKYDAQGNIKDWWTKEDGEKFQERADRLADHYDSFAAVDTFHVDGKLTLGENIADLGGLTISFSAFKKTEQYKKGESIDGFTPAQRFYLGYAQVWANNIRDEALKLRLKTDVHSPGKFRANGPLMNLPEFFDAFGVNAGDTMRNTDDKIVKIW
ncbi:MAG: M13 family metallopeptidase [Ignavibacteriales bacterium]|nr:M13 family metallopeptidase [Ignavibacteriales bacterium]